MKYSVKSTGGSFFELGYYLSIMPSSPLLILTGTYNSVQLQFDNNTITNANVNNSSDIFFTALDTNLITGINESTYPDDYFSVYPNPAYDYVIIEMKNISNNYHLEIIDLNGKTLWSKTAATSNKLLINTSLLSAGVYLIKIQSDNFISTKKIIITR